VKFLLKIQVKKQFSTYCCLPADLSHASCKRKKRGRNEEGKAAAALWKTRRHLRCNSHPFPFNPLSPRPCFSQYNPSKQLTCFSDFLEEPRAGHLTTAAAARRADGHGGPACAPQAPAQRHEGQARGYAKPHAAILPGRARCRSAEPAPRCQPSPPSTQRRLPWESTPVSPAPRRLRSETLYLPYFNENVFILLQCRPLIQTSLSCYLATERGIHFLRWYKTNTLSANAKSLILVLQQYQPSRLPRSSGSFSSLVCPKSSKTQLALRNLVGPGLANRSKVPTGQRCQWHFPNTL